jgi:hypothetical protein
MPDFSIPFPDTLKSIAGNPPFTLHPYNILGLTTLGAKVPLRFTASGLPNGFYQAEYDVVAQGQLHKVILLATVKTILKSTVTPAVFDTVFLCQNQTRSIFIDNPNDFAVTVTNLIIGGPDKADFSVITAVPLVIAPNSRGEIQLSFAPSAVTGSRNATVTVTLDLPKGFTQTFPLSAYADQLSSSFWARNNIHILPGEETVFPIYARSPMELFSSSSFELDVWYDPTNIEDEPDKLIQDNTLTLQDAYYLVLGDTAGYRQYFCETTDGSILTGGSDTTQMPLVYLTFKSHYNPGDVPAHFHQDVDINYKVTFDHSPFLSGCILSLAPAGRITLDSTCETVYLLQDTFLYPQGSFIVPIHPNPVSTFATFEFDVPELARTLQLTPNSSDPKVIDTKIPVRLDIIDMLGNIAAVVTDEMKKPGTYQIQWDARGVKPGAYLVRLITAGTVKTRQIVIVR